MKAPKSKDQHRIPTVAAAALALLTTGSGIRASDTAQVVVLPVITSKRQNEDEHTPYVILAPQSAGPLFADHSSHASHSSHYSSSNGSGDYVPPVTPDPNYTTPTTTTPPPAPTPPPDATPPPPSATMLDSVVLNKLTQVTSLWPKQVKLIQRFAFTEIKDGVAVGIVGAPPGTMVDLLVIKGTRLVVSYLGNKAEIDADITDIGDRVDVNAVIAAPLPSSTNATSSVSSATGTNSAPKVASP